MNAWPNSRMRSVIAESSSSPCVVSNPGPPQIPHAPVAVLVDKEVGRAQRGTDLGVSVDPRKDAISTKRLDPVQNSCEFLSPLSDATPPCLVIMHVGNHPEQPVLHPIRTAKGLRHVLVDVGDAGLDLPHGMQSPANLLPEVVDKPDGDTILVEIEVNVTERRQHDLGLNGIRPQLVPVLAVARQSDDRCGHDLPHGPDWHEAIDSPEPVNGPTAHVFQRVQVVVDGMVKARAPELRFNVVMHEQWAGLKPVPRGDSRGAQPPQMRSQGERQLSAMTSSGITRASLFQPRTAIFQLAPRSCSSSSSSWRDLIGRSRPQSPSVRQSSGSSSWNATILSRLNS